MSSLESTIECEFLGDVCMCNQNGEEGEKGVCASSLCSLLSLHLIIIVQEHKTFRGWFDHTLSVKGLRNGEMYLDM